jgi:hypothetical protein
VLAALSALAVLAGALRVRAVLPAISASLSFVVAWFAPPVAAFASVSISLALLVLGRLASRLLDEP